MIDINFVRSQHDLYNLYNRDWRHQQRSYWGGTEYKRGRYLRAYKVDMETPSETIQTYTTREDGAVISKHHTQLQIGTSTYDTDKGQDFLSGNFYGEKLDNTPLYNYVKLIVSEYNSILFRNPPYRQLPDTDEIKSFTYDVDGEGNDIDEFMSQVDTMTTVFGSVWVMCVKHAGADTPTWRLYTPLEVKNWQYEYNSHGDLYLKRVSIELERTNKHSVHRYIDAQQFVTVFIGDDADYLPPGDLELEQIDDRVWMYSEPNELGYVPLYPIYQNQKIYPGVGTTPIQDIAQIQRSVYGYCAEIYSAVTYGTHPTLLVDETTDQLNDGAIGAEPGSRVLVQSSLSGDPAHVFEFVSPSTGAISEIQNLIDNQVEKLSQLAMLRSEDLIRSSRSGEHLEQFDDKLSAVIRKKATNLENAEYNLWQCWYDWQGTTMPQDFAVVYNRQYNRRAVEHEVDELKHLLNAIQSYQDVMGEPAPEDTEFLQKARDSLRQRIHQLVEISANDVLR